MTIYHIDEQVFTSQNKILNYTRNKLNDIYDNSSFGRVHRTV